MMQRVALILLLAALPGSVSANWDVPVNLGPLVNSDADEFGISLSSDGTILYFDSDRAGGFGDRDIYQSVDGGGGFGAAANLGVDINTALREYCPSISGDGTRLLFTSHGFNLRISDDVGGQWTAGTPLGAPVNTQLQEWAGRFVSDTEIVFSGRDLPGGEGGHDVWQSTFTGSWSAPANLDLNTGSDEYAPFVAAGGDSMYLVVDGDIHVSYWNGSLWSITIPLQGGVNSVAFYETSPVLSPDGMRLYFTSERSGGEGGYDIWSSDWVGTLVDVEEVAPPSFQLAAARPNPFNPKTTIGFTLAEAGEARLAIYDVSGRLVRTLFEGRAVGAVSASWDGRDDAGQSLPSGTYLYRLTTESESQTRKLSLVR